jgi:hypothetical protein
MYLYGFSLNNLSLMALIVAAGLVVDDAIVVLENISRHIERGLSPLRAAMKGSARGRLHAAGHEPVARRRLRFHPVHGRAGRAALPRVLHHPGGGHAGLPRRLTHPHPKPVRPVAASPGGRGPEPVAPSHRRGLQHRAPRLRPVARLGAAARDAHLAAPARHDRAQCQPLHPHPQGLPPGSRTPASCRALSGATTVFPSRSCSPRSRSTGA